MSCNTKVTFSPPGFGGMSVLPAGPIKMVHLCEGTKEKGDP